MTMQPFPPAPEMEPIAPVNREMANRNTITLLEEIRGRLYEYLKNLLREPPAPAVKMPPKQRWMWFLDKLADAYYIGPRFQGMEPIKHDEFLDFPQFFDVQGYQEEYSWLLRDDYVDNVRQGVYRPPLARPFVNYVDGMWLGLEVWREWFAELDKRYRDGDD